MLKSADNAGSGAFDSTVWRSWAPAEADLPAPRILIIDQRPEMRAMIDDALGKWCECEHVATVGEARERLTEADFELVLCDPGSDADGALALPTLISSKYPAVAVLLITDEDDPTVAKQAFALGVHGYLLEPIQSGQLLIAVMSALRQRDLEIAAGQLGGEHGGVVAVGGISTDITAESEATRLRDELGTSERAAIEDLRLSRQETVERLTRAIDRHDPSTGKHVIRMGAIVGLLGTLLHLDPAKVDLLRLAAPMHDVGKIATPDEILRKQGPLTAEERTEMEKHTLVGGEILAGSKGDLLQLAASIALTHHERYDGSGYPRHLVGEEIPLEGRIAAVADVFDALLADRVYRPALSPGEAVRVMKAGRDGQFDPEIVDLLLEHLDEALGLRQD